MGKFFFCSGWHALIQEKMEGWSYSSGETGFFYYLPYSVNPDQTMSKNIVILIVDDDVEDQDILEEFLLKQNENIQFYRAFNGKEAIALLKRDHRIIPDLMVLDFKMPLMGAADILKYFREEQSFQSTSKVVWSTSDQSSHQQICIENGAVACFVKPDSPAGLANLAKDLLKLIAHQSS
jgi:CheY-like chemotaxis protein